MSKALDGVLIKKAHTQDQYTEIQVEELIKCMDPETGYLYFARNFAYIQHPVHGKLLFEPFDYQVELMESYHTHRFNINMLPRQTGKTTCAAVYLTWFAMFHPDQTILIAAHKHSGALEIMQRVRYIYELCPDHIRAGVVGYNKGSIDFENGSRLVSATTTDNTGRGMSISLLYCDEFAFVEANMAEEFWTSISPTLATGGRAIITSTPNSDEDTFATIWKGSIDRFSATGEEQVLGANGFFGFTIPWDAHPQRNEEWKKEEIQRIGVERFRREYNCEFLVFDETLISSVKLIEMEGSEPLFNTGTVRWYKKPSASYMYAIALDPSMGTGGNHAGLQIFELPTYEQVGEWQDNMSDIPSQIRVMRDVCIYISEVCGTGGSNVFWSVENNGLGEAALIVIADIGEENIPGIFMSEPMRKGHVRKFRRGFNTTHSTKVSACSRLKTFVELGKMAIKSKPLISELKTFVAAGASYSAKNNGKDDLTSALLLIIRMIVVMKDWDPRIYNTFVQAEIEDGYEPPMPIYISNY